MAGWDSVIDATRAGEPLRQDVYDVIWSVLEGKLSPMVRNADMAEQMAKAWAQSCVDMLVANDVISDQA